jgi:two-component system chemotaxis sensor kinase CheA
MSELDLNQDALMAIFVAEAHEDITALESGLIAVETATDDHEAWRDLLRLAHTLKGNASCVALQAITEFAHAYEELLESICERRIAFDASVITLLLSGIDTLRTMVDEGDQATLSAADREVIGRLLGVARPGELPIAESVLRKESSPSVHTVVTGGRTVRVATEKLNRMLDLVGEIAIARGRVSRLLTNREALDVDALIEAERQIDQLQSEQQELIMRARMVPIGPLFRQYARTVRDIAAAHGKNARLITIGDEVELDTTAVELLRDPLTHLIRNAVDHGIEPSAQRVAAGKPAIAHVTLEARHEGSHIIVRLSDDGAGIDSRAVLHQAKQLGFDADRLGEAELLRLIFEPGFSTAENVTDLSGRGVGMDAVLRGVEALRGTIVIDSTPGEGTTFTMRVPLTLAVIDGFSVSSAGDTYIVPMSSVIECTALPRDHARNALTGVMQLRDDVVPYVRLRRLFALGGDAPERENVLVVQHNGALAGLVVDSLDGAGQVLIKPLSDYLPDVAGIAGSSILGNGRVALILDPAIVLRSVATGDAAGGLQ